MKDYLYLIYLPFLLLLKIVEIITPNRTADIEVAIGVVTNSYLMTFLILFSGLAIFKSIFGKFVKKIRTKFRRGYLFRLRILKFLNFPIDQQASRTRLF